MAHDKTATTIRVYGKSLSCPVCSYDKFWTRKTLLNSRAATLFNLEWANKNATNHICDQCGHILWFVEK